MRRWGTLSRPWADGVFHVGLAGLLLVNGVVAVLHPQDFTRLVARSAIGQWLELGDLAWLAPLIALNDVVLGIAVLVALRFLRARAVVLAWAGAWLLAVTLVKLSAL